MQHDQRIAEAMIEAVGLGFDSVQRQIKALQEAQGVTVLDTINFAQAFYPEGSLAEFNGGLWVYYASGERPGWKCIANGLFDVKIADEANGQTNFTFILSDGSVIHRTATKAPPKKPAATKAVKALKRTKPVKLVTSTRAA